MEKRKKPKKPSWFAKIIAKIVVSFMLIGKKHKLVKIGMEELEANKTPYLCLCNHLQFFDFVIYMNEMWKKDINHVVSIEGFSWWRGWLMELAGAISKRRFTKNLVLVREILYCLHELKDIVGIYPEAKYSPYGTTSHIPESVAKIVKLAKVPVVSFIFNGHHILHPQWGPNKDRKVPVSATMKQIITAEETQTLSAPEIYERIKTAFYYNDYEYQKENNIRIKYKNRAKGLHHILYKCPVCTTEFEMESYKATLKCKHCLSEWEITELNEIVSKTNNVNTFQSIPEWAEWEKEEVRKEIKSESYSFTDTMDGWALRKGKFLKPLGKVIFNQGLNGIELIYKTKKGAEIKRTKLPNEIFSIQNEYDGFGRFLHMISVFGISWEDETIFLKPTKTEFILKIDFACEVMGLDYK